MRNKEETINKGPLSFPLSSATEGSKGSRKKTVASNRLFRKTQDMPIETTDSPGNEEV